MQYPIGVEWTLVYEVFFYALTAMLCLLPTTVGRQVAVVAWTLAIIAANELVSRQVTTTLPDASQVAFSYRNFAFIAGMCAWWTREFTEEHAIFFFMAALVLLTLSLVVGREQHFLPAYCLDCLDCAALVIVGSSTAANNFLGPRSFLVRLGDGSYGIYLMHVPVVVLFLATSGFKGVPTVVVAIFLALAVGTLYGLAEFSTYRFLSRRIDGYLTKVFSGTGLYVARRQHGADATDPAVRTPITADTRLSSPSETASRLCRTGPRSRVTPWRVSFSANRRPPCTDPALEHFQETWPPVLRRKCDQISNLERIPITGDRNPL